MGLVDQLVGREYWVFGSEREKAKGAKGGGDAELDLKIHGMTTMVRRWL